MEGERGRAMGVGEVGGRGKNDDGCCGCSSVVGGEGVVGGG